MALGLGTAIWALAERRAAQRARRGLKGLSARARAAIVLRDTLLAEGNDVVVLWDGSGDKTVCLRDADLLLRDCIAGPDGAAVSAGLEALHQRGEGFQMTARDGQGSSYRLRGRAVGASAAVWIAAEPAGAGQFAALLDALPVPVWLRDSGLTLRWANRAFLSALRHDSLEAALAANAAIDRNETDFAAAALAAGTPRETERYTQLGGRWRSLALAHIPLGDGAVAGMALDVSAAADAQARLKQEVQARAHLLDRLHVAVAMFGADRRLEWSNAAFAALWDLPQAWLDGQPSHGDVLDRLREFGRLPEQRDYQGWKRQRLALHASDGAVEETWPLRDGRTLAVHFCPNPAGGAVVLYEDVSEKFALERSLKTQLAAQSATLDALGEAVAAFGPDGKLTLYNAAFAAIWDLDPVHLAERPHIREVANACQSKFGDTAMWDRLVGTVSSGPAQRRDWRKIHRGDGAVLSLATIPLPDRATLVTFADVTDRFGFEAASRERNEALEMLDRLRADYIKQLSYELRTPLNTVLGFAEQLAGDGGHALDGVRQERIEAIVAGAYALKKVADDMLAGLVDQTVSPPRAQDAQAEPPAAERDRRNATQ